MTLRIRSMLRLAFLALPFQMRQRSRSTSPTIADFACILAASSVGKPLAVCVACGIRIAMWNQSRMGGVVTPAPRWPIDVRLDAIAGDASKPGKPHRHFAEQRRDAVPRQSFRWHLPLQ